MPAILRSINTACDLTCAAVWCRLSSAPCRPCISTSFVGPAALHPDLMPAAATGPSPKVYPWSPPASPKSRATCSFACRRASPLEHLSQHKKSYFYTDQHQEQLLPALSRQRCTRLCQARQGLELHGALPSGHAVPLVPLSTSGSVLVLDVNWSASDVLASRSVTVGL